MGFSRAYSLIGINAIKLQPTESLGDKVSKIVLSAEEYHELLNPILAGSAST